MVLIELLKYTGLLHVTRGENTVHNTIYYHYVVARSLHTEDEKSGIIPLVYDFFLSILILFQTFSLLTSCFCRVSTSLDYLLYGTSDFLLFLFLRISCLTLPTSVQTSYTIPWHYPVATRIRFLCLSNDPDLHPFRSSSLTSSFMLTSPPVPVKHTPEPVQFLKIYMGFWLSFGSFPNVRFYWFNETYCFPLLKV